MNVGAATKLKLIAAKVSLEKKRTFRGDCKAVVLNILIKFAEKHPLVYRLICSACCFNPLNMFRYHAESCQLFKTLADHIFALLKIKASVVDKSKSQMDEFLKVARFDQKEKLSTLIFAKIVWIYFLLITSRSALRNYGRFLRMYVHFRMDKASQKGASQSTKR